METQEKTNFALYLEGLGLKMTAKADYNDYAKGWALNTNHYRVTLSREGRTMRFWFYQGYGIKHEPTLEGVIECLASDRTFTSYTLKEYGDELGWDSETASTYRHLINLNARYERVIGDTSTLDEIYEKATA